MRRMIVLVSLISLFAHQLGAATIGQSQLERLLGEKENQQQLIGKMIQLLEVPSKRDHISLDSNLTRLIEESLARNLKHVVLEQENNEDSSQATSQVVQGLSKDITDSVRNFLDLKSKKDELEFQSKLQEVEIHLRRDLRTVQNSLRDTMDSWNQRFELLHSRMDSETARLADNCRQQLYKSSAKIPWSGIPGSCSDLHFLGHTVNGIYTLKSDQTLRNVYCDFNKSAEQKGFQTDLGQSDSKTMRIAFHVARSTELKTNGVVITYDRTMTNVGGAMNIKTGVFTAPTRGTYIFSGHFLKEYNKAVTHITIRVNGGRVSGAYSGSADANTHITIAMTAVVQLNIGDQVTTFLDSGTLNGGEWGYFNGFLLDGELQ